MKWGFFESVGFEITEKEISKTEGHPGTHGCSVNQEVVVIIKTKIIHGENHTNKVTECASRNGRMRAKIITSINTFIIRDVSV